jgi:hypothetical protein
LPDKPTLSILSFLGFGLQQAFSGLNMDFWIIEGVGFWPLDFWLGVDGRLQLFGNWSQLGSLANNAACFLEEVVAQ